MILQGDALEELRKLPDKCCSVCVTSPPYFNARDYGAADQLETERDLYRNLYNELLSKTMKGASA